MVVFLQMHLTESLLSLLRRSSRRQRFGASKLTTSRALPTCSGVGECSPNWKSRPAFCESTLLCSRLAVCSTTMRLARDEPSSRHCGVVHRGGESGIQEWSSWLSCLCPQCFCGPKSHIWNEHMDRPGNIYSGGDWDFNLKHSNEQGRRTEWVRKQPTS